MSQISKIQALLNKPSVELRFVDETNYSGLNVPFLFDGPSHNPINNLSESLLKELDKITIIANKEILGKSDWSGFGNASGALPTTTTTTTNASSYWNAVSLDSATMVYQNSGLIRPFVSLNVDYTTSGFNQITNPPQGTMVLHAVQIPTSGVTTSGVDMNNSMIMELDGQNYHLFLMGYDTTTNPNQLENLIYPQTDPENMWFNANSLVEMVDNGDTSSSSDVRLVLMSFTNNSFSLIPNSQSSVIGTVANIINLIQNAPIPTTTTTTTEEKK